VEPLDLARHGPPCAQLQSVEYPPSSRICLTGYRSDAPVITLCEFQALLDSLLMSEDIEHKTDQPPPQMSGPRIPSSYPFWQYALEDGAFVFADREEAIKASRLWIEAVQTVREDMQTYLEMAGQVLVYDLNNPNPLITASPDEPSVRHPRLISRFVNGFYSWTPWRIPLDATLDVAIDPNPPKDTSLESPAPSAFTTDLAPVERHVPEVFLVTPDSDHDMGFNKGSLSVIETMKDSQALHPWRSRSSLSTI
jgi:hypothetical protein